MDKGPAVDYRIIIHFANGSPDVVFGASDENSAMQAYRIGLRMAGVSVVEMGGVIRGGGGKAPATEPSPPFQTEQGQSQPLKPFRAPPPPPSGEEDADKERQEEEEPDLLTPKQGFKRAVGGAGVQQQQQNSRRHHQHSKQPRYLTKTDVAQVEQFRKELKAFDDAAPSDYVAGQRAALATYVVQLLTTQLEELDWTDHQSYKHEWEDLIALCSPGTMKRPRTE
jgi:hypothetical protein